MTDAQKQQLRELATKHRHATQVQHKALAESRVAFHKAAAAETVDETAVKAAADKLAGSLSEGALARAKFRSAVREVFTAEQREKLKALRQSHAKPGPGSGRPGPGRQGLHGGSGRRGGDAKPAEKATEKATEKAADKPAEPAKPAAEPPKAEEKPKVEEKPKIEDKPKTAELPKAEEGPNAGQKPPAAEASSAAVPDDVGQTQNGAADL